MSEGISILLACSCAKYRGEANKERQIVAPSVVRVRTTQTLLQLFEILTAKHSKLSGTVPFKAQLRDVLTAEGGCDADANEMNGVSLADLRTVSPFFTAVHFFIRAEDEPEPTRRQSEETNIRPTRNAFHILMNASSNRELGTDMVPIEDNPFSFQGGGQAGGSETAKDRMAADFILHVQTSGVQVMRRTMKKVVCALREFCRLLWMIDGHVAQVAARSAFDPAARRFMSFVGKTTDSCVHKRWKEHNHRRPRLSSDELATRCNSASAALLDLTFESYLNSISASPARRLFSAMNSFITTVARLADHMDSNRSRVASCRGSSSNSATLNFPSTLQSRGFSDRMPSTSDTATATQDNADHCPSNIATDNCNDNNDKFEMSTESGVTTLSNSSRPLQRAHLYPLECTLRESPIYKPFLLDFEVHSREGSPLRASKAVTREVSTGIALRQTRRRAREDIKSGLLCIPIGYYSCVVPGPIGTIFVIWRVPEHERFRSEDRQATAVVAAARFVPSIMSRSQTKHYTSAMVAIGKNGSLKTAAAQALLQSFGFRTSSRTVADDVVTARALSVLLGTDTNFAVSQDEEGVALAEDLRRDRMPAQREKFSAFFAAAEKFLDTHVNDTGAAVDQRRAVGAGGEARIYMPVAMSLTDLRDRISQYATESLTMREGQDFMIPSLEWLRLQFIPQRSGILSAAKFTGRLRLHRAVQSRTIRENHADAHFVRADWLYVKQWGHRFASEGLVCFISVDDKCGVKIGEPGLPIGAVSRRKKKAIVVGGNSRSSDALLAADHDYSSVTLTPSVAFFIDTPGTALGSYAKGRTILTLKNAVFESSNPIRHAAELSRAFKHRYAGSTIPPVVIVLSDGGCDHRTNLYSVQLSYIWLMFKLDLDRIVCCRTAPGDSWTNPAERRMADLNMAWEQSSFSRTPATEVTSLNLAASRWFERKMKGVGSMAAIRQMAQCDEARQNSIDVPQILHACCAEVVSALGSSVRRINGDKSGPWDVVEAAKEDECAAVVAFLQKEICPSLDVGKMRASDVKGTSAEKMIQAHIIESHRYRFELSKRPLVGKECIPACPLCSMTSRMGDCLEGNLKPVPHPVQLSTGSYAPFDDLYGKIGSENAPPSAHVSLLPRSAKLIHSGTNARDALSCENCGRYRAIYGNKKDFVGAQNLLEAAADTRKYICGISATDLFPESLCESHPSDILSHPSVPRSLKNTLEALAILRRKVYMQENISCATAIEEAIYTAACPAVQDKSELCCFCGTSGSLLRETRCVFEGRVEKVQTSRPHCAYCREFNLPRYPKTRNRKKRDGTVIKKGSSNAAAKHQKTSHEHERSESTGAEEEKSHATASSVREPMHDACCVGERMCRLRGQPTSHRCRNVKCPGGRRLHNLCRLDMGLSSLEELVAKLSPECLNDIESVFFCSSRCLEEYTSSPTS